MKIVREASDLGIPPGRVATEVRVDERDFHFHKTVRTNGEVVAWVYRPKASDPNNHDELHILND